MVLVRSPNLKDNNGTTKVETKQTHLGLGSQNSQTGGPFRNYSSKQNVDPHRIEDATCPQTGLYSPVTFPQSIHTQFCIDLSVCCKEAVWGSGSPDPTTTVGVALGQITFFTLYFLKVKLFLNLLPKRPKFFNFLLL